ncbi:hypothetical protein A8990_107121 [Paenibacillus taihuensis]|uniref:Uncharacterized protein n=1 Tax=Paenibacillus taihuensis TaxID=1156355 RepID=A0A3D9S8I0_9BACL|nr:hypothetical protein [Paenibacillus taihuensis]REE89025.1 hypothetical protein A8990_107121 [Paenibacillus taihuensis]
MMWSLAGVVVLSGFFAALELPSLKGQKKERWTFWLLLILSTGLGMAYVSKLTIPNPLELIAFIFKPIGYWLHNVLPPAK